MDTYNLINTLVNSYIKYCQKRDRSQNTIRKHLLNLTEMADFFADHSIRYYEDLSHDLLQGYLDEKMILEPVSVVQSKRVSIQSFCRWVTQESGLKLLDPSQELVMSPKRIQPYKGVSDRNIAAIINNCGNDFSGIRDKAILMTLSDTGMRVVELCALKLRDCLLQEHIIRIRNKQTSRYRVVEITNNTVDYIKAYLELVPFRSDWERVFRTLTNEELNPGSITAMMRKRCLDSGVYEIITPVDLRNTYGIKLMTRTHNPWELRRRMGFKKVPNPIRYLTSIKDD